MIWHNGWNCVYTIAWLHFQMSLILSYFENSNLVQFSSLLALVRRKGGRELFVLHTVALICCCLLIVIKQVPICYAILWPNNCYWTAVKAVWVSIFVLTSLVLISCTMWKRRIRLPLKFQAVHKTGFDFQSSNQTLWIQGDRQRYNVKYVAFCRGRSHHTRHVLVFCFVLVYHEWIAPFLMQTMNTEI